MRPIVVDFETQSIAPRPKYPPEPVGVAIMYPGKEPKYLAWGHPTENNCTKEKAREILLDLWKGARPLLFHNARFDLDVAEVHLGLQLPVWDRVHDTLYTLFLHDPHALSLSLKPAAERYLKMPPEERDAVADWLVEHGVIRKDQNPGPHISKAPGDVVGRYAIGDVVRTWKLHELLHGKLDAGMLRAYDRERRLMPILLENERQGLRFDTERALKDLPGYERAVQQADDWLRWRLAAPGLNVDSDEELADALDTAKVVTEWTLTPKKKERSTSKKYMTIEKFHDPKVFQILQYRNKLSTALSLNLRPWAEESQAADGYVYTEWTQVRQAHGNDGIAGARTGRPTCSKFINVPKDFEDKNDGFDFSIVQKVLPEVPDLPLVRKYLLPDKGHGWGHVDWSQQEFRIIAHYAEGELLEAYRENPRTDFHQLMQDRLKGVGLDLQRRLVKIINFSIKYGSGAPALAGLLRIPVDEAKAIINGVKQATPSVTALDLELKRRGREGIPIRTWGGRLYYCEPPRYSEKYRREMTFEYKLLSYLIQGSGADAVKEALIRYNEVKKNGRVLTAVYDEINISAPKKALKAEVKLLQEAMESLEFDVQMLTDADIGRSWGELEAA